MSGYGDGLARWVDDVPLGAGAFVMATGIVSIGLHLVGAGVVSAVLFGVAAAAWLALAAIFLHRALRRPARFRREASSPAVLSAVAGTATLGQRLIELGPAAAADTALGLSVCLCLALLPGAARGAKRAAGTAFVLAVSIESLAVLAASCAPRSAGRLACDRGPRSVPDRSGRLWLGSWPTSMCVHWPAARVISGSPVARLRSPRSPARSSRTPPEVLSSSGRFELHLPTLRSRS